VELSRHRERQQNGIHMRSRQARLGALEDAIGARGRSERE